MIATVTGHHGEVLAAFVGDDAADAAAAFCTDNTDAASAAVTPCARETVEVRDLRAGDVMLPTKAAVLGSLGLSGKVYPQPSAGTRTPPGKLDVLLRHPQGRLRTTTWGRYTKVTVTRAVEEEEPCHVEGCCYREGHSETFPHRVQAEV